ncbi:MAG TPA: periplasmic heavy metal sensor [Candidatus Cybelea sp.]|nr:periplasmic heavy metal sensor [Candidatus Cybelea sp.]
MSTPSAMPGGEASAPGRALRIGLIASLVVNLLLVGLIAGHMLRGPWFGREGGLPIERVTGPMPPDVRETVRATLRELRPHIRDKIKAVREAREQVHDAFVASPFDAEKLKAAFANLREKTLAVQQDVQAAIADAIAKMPPEKRP